MNRRSFLSSIIAAASAPAIVRADSLMQIVPHKAGTNILVPAQDLCAASLEEILAAGPVYKAELRYGFAQTLWPGIKYLFDQAYGDLQWPKD